MGLHRLGIALGQDCVGFLFLALLCGAAPRAQQTLNGPLARPVGRFSSFQVTPDGGRVVFASEQDRYYWPEVYSVPVDGSSSSVKLSGELSGPADEFHSFLLSPDGSRVVSVFAFRMMSAPTDGSAAAIQIASLGCSTCDDAAFAYGFTPDGVHVLYRDNVRVDEYNTLYSVCSAPVDGSGPAVRLSELVSSEPQYVGSPDGAYVAFVTDHLYGRPIDGSAPAVRLDPGLSLPWPPSAPAIASDGTVVFVADGLYAVPIDGSTAPVPLSGSLVSGGNVVVFVLLPDGSGVVYKADALQDGRYELFTAPIDGSTPPVLLSGPLVPGGDVGQFALLPDSSRVVYAADALQDGRDELFIARLDASVPPRRLSHTLDPGGNVGDFQITSDGTRAVYKALEGGVTRLFSVPTDGGWPAQRLSGRLVAGGDVLSYRIAPDSRWVIYRADQRVDEQVELFSVPIDGSMRSHLRKVGEPPVRRLNVPLPETSSGVDWFAFAPDAGRVLYLADELSGLHSVLLRGGPSVRLSEEVGPGGSSTFPTTQTSMAGLRAVFVFQQDYTTDSALLSVPFAGGTPLRLNPPLARGAPDGAVHAYRSSPDGRRTVYLADQEILGVFELYGVPTEGGVPAVKLNGALPYRGDVSGSGDEWMAPDAEGSFEITPDGSRVVYTADQDVNDEIELYVAPIDGLAPALRLGSGGDVLPGLALDAPSERVVFRQRDAQNVERLFSQRLDGSDTPFALSGALVAGGNVLDFALTPDGTGVVFRADAEVHGRYELYFVPIDGSAPRHRVSPVLGSGRIVSTFALTQDSRRVLFLANPHFSQQFELYSTELVGGLPLELDPELAGTGNVRSFVSSPDGAWAVFAASPPSSSDVQLYAVPCDGSAPPHRVNGQLASGGWVVSDDGTFLVSPDSRRVAYIADEDADLKAGLYSVPIDGSSPARRLSDPLGSVRNTRLHISPDSRRVFYVASYPPSYPPTSGLFAVGIGGATTPLLLSAPLASGADVLSFDVDSFGLNAVYGDGHQELFHAPTDASRPPRYVDSSSEATFTANPRFALYLQGHGNQAFPPLLYVELHSFVLPMRLRHGDPPELR